jgi:hypothetical protein
MSADYADLRAKVTRRSHNVLFAKAHTSGRDMGEIVREVLDKWAAEEIHAAIVITRIARCEGAVGECGGLLAASEGLAGASQGSPSPEGCSAAKPGVRP